jgi:hypothetical protein
MSHMPLISFSAVAMLCMGLVTAAIAGGRPMPPGNVDDNIALGKTYTMSPAPNYPLCSDSPGDATQLTDGYNYAGTSSLWVQLSTVGWAWLSTTPAITIDLGVVQPIKGVSFYTAARGNAGVYWPSAINLEVSNDNINYYSIGDLVSLNNIENGAPPPPDNTNRLYCFRTNTLTAHGRFVRLTVTPSGSSVFVDEIKVIRGSNSLLGQNIALNKTYTLSSPPNYPYCTDAGDSTQLTDGNYTSGFSFWTQLSTVGWNYLCVNANWISIDIDLGQIQPIEGISFNTAGGFAGVLWPWAISVLVSDDGVNYYNAGELVTLSSEHGQPPQYGYLVRSYWTDRLATHGRYVKIIPSFIYFVFVDEIEVYQGSNGMLAQPSRGTAASDITDYVKKNQNRGGIARRIVLDAQDVQAQTDAQTGLAQAVRDQINSLLSTSLNELVYLPDSDPATFQAVLPLSYDMNYPTQNITHARVFRALAKLRQAQGETSLSAWQASSQWDPISPTQTYTAGSPAITVRMLQNEYRSAAFNLSNPTDNDLTVNLNIQGLPGGTNPSYIMVHEVAWTDTKYVAWAFNPIASALPVAAGNTSGFTVSIPSGMIRQVWLTFHPTITNPGTYSGTIVADSTAGTVNIPIVFQLSCLGFPAQPSLGLGGFDYTNCDAYAGMTLQNRDAFIAHLREHFVNTTWGTTEVMPNPAAFTSFDAWAARWTGIRNYQIFLAIGNTFNGYTIGTPEFNNAIAVWINAYVAHWQGMGLNLNQIALLLVDEPWTAAQADTTIAWANAIHAVQPNLKIWSDPSFSDPFVSYAQSMFQSVDIICPNRQFFIGWDETYRDAFRQQRAAGKTLNFYSCIGPASVLDPYSYYRLQAWTCMKENATAMHYWAFGDEKDCWNEYNLFKENNYSPFFLNATTVTAGKPMEAIREGVEDYEYLVMLKNMIIYWQGQPNPPSLTAAIALRDSVADAVLNATGADQFYWTDTKDRGIADQTRIEILDMLEALSPQTGANIAQGKTYTLSPSPNYPYCTDAGDATQLTDGIYTAGNLWTQLSTVGWVWPSSTPTIIIDLGAIQPIKGVSYNTAGGVAGVQWPTAIDMFISNDGANYSSIGDLAAISNSEHSDAPAYGTYAVHRYWTTQLATYGRYVKIQIIQSPFVFVDEIEVYKN